MTCDDCDKESEDVSECYCPFAEEIHDEKVSCKLCNDCYHERLIDI